MDTEVQSTAPHENGSKIEQSSSEPPNGETVSNGKDSKSSPKHHTPRQTRSRSRTPQKKKSKKTDEDTNKKVASTDDNVNGHQTRKTRSSDSNKPELNEIVEEVEVSSEIENVSEEPPKEESDNQEVTIVSEEVQIETETVVIESQVLTIENIDSVKAVEGIEMEPLILPPDEQDPELQFDENSDMDSVRGSPIQTRCKTRRSQTRNIPSPKTPKSTTDSESEKISTEPTLTPENFTDTFDEDVSTRAEIGSDTTRLEFMENNSSIQSEESNYVSNFNDDSYRESIRRVTARRTIRPLNDSYRQRALRNCLNKTDLNVSYSNYDSVDRLMGVKRKRSPTPEDRKRFKEESSSFVSYLSSPLSNFKRRFSTDFGASSPKLTGYKDSTNDIHEDELHQEVDSEDFEKKNRCSVM